jgi:hypothetical protein
MRNLISKILKEYLINELNISYIKQYKENISIFENTVTTLISKNSENNNKLYLFVGFQNIGNNIMEYYYSFILYNNNNPISDFMNKRSEVSKYLPDDIKNKNLILPIIIDMTKILLNNNLPENILRKTSEILDNDNSIQRYEVIGNILINEYNYKLEKTYQEHGIMYWLYKKNNSNNNQTLNEEYLISSLPTTEDTNRMVKRDFLPIFNEHLKNNPI